MSGGTVVPRHQCPGGHFFQGDSHASDTGFRRPGSRTLPVSIRVLRLACSYSSASSPAATHVSGFFSITHKLCSALPKDIRNCSFPINCCTSSTVVHSIHFAVRPSTSQLPPDWFHLLFWSLNGISFDMILR